MSKNTFFFADYTFEQEKNFKILREQIRTSISTRTDSKAPPCDSGCSTYIL